MSAQEQHQCFLQQRIEALQNENKRLNKKLPISNNKLLNQLYLDHVSVVEEKQFQKCAFYYAQALSDAGQAIQDILENPDVTIQKSVAITELIKTWKL